MFQETTAVTVFVLRRTSRHETEVLLIKRGGSDGGQDQTWSPITGPLRAEEREADVIVRELFETTALQPERLYATPFSGVDEDVSRGAGGRIGIFVAYVGDEAEALYGDSPEDSRWFSIRQAAPLLSLESDQRAIARVVTDFVRQAPDESLRVL